MAYSEEFGRGKVCIICIVLWVEPMYVLMLFNVLMKMAAAFFDRRLLFPSNLEC